MSVSLVALAGPWAASLGAQQPAAAQQSAADARVIHAAAEAEPAGFEKFLLTGARLFGKGQDKPGEERDIINAEPKGSSSSSARKQAIAALPLDQLTPEQRARVNGLVKSTSYFRRLPKVTFAVEPEVYGYFLAHPDAAVSMWRAMKISKLEMWQTGRYEYEADTGDGSAGKIEVLLSTADKHLAICEGTYKSPLLSKPIAANSMVLLQTGFVTEADGTVYVTHRADLFVSFPSQTIDVAAKIFSPLAVALTDRTFTEISLFLRMISVAMVQRPDWVEDTAARMDGVKEIRKQQLIELTNQVHAANLKRASERAAQRASASRDAREQSDPRQHAQPAKSGTPPTTRVGADALRPNPVR
jgi:hypothetical protein